MRNFGQMTQVYAGKNGSVWGQKQLQKPDPDMGIKIKADEGGLVDMITSKSPALFPKLSIYGPNNKVGQVHHFFL